MTPYDAARNPINEGPPRHPFKRLCSKEEAEALDAGARYLIALAAYGLDHEEVIGLAIRASLAITEFERTDCKRAKFIRKAIERQRDRILASRKD